MEAGMDNGPPMAATVESPTAVVDTARALIHARQTILPKRLAAPGPDGRELDLILEAAAAAPDHRALLPWRFVIVPASERARLAEVFAQALLERDPSAEPAQLAQAREKAYRAPLLLLAIVRLSGDGEDDDVMPAERMVSAGCAIQNMLLMATAQGFGSSLTSGKALSSPGLRNLFGVSPREQALCFISIGTVASHKPMRVRPCTASYVSSLRPSLNPPPSRA
jgi:nitroreductase